jgi:hypothetical protein
MAGAPDKRGGAMTRHRPTERQLRQGENMAYGPKPNAPGVKIRRFTPYRNAAGTLLGFLSIEMPSGLILNDAKLMIGPAGKRWVAPRQ